MRQWLKGRDANVEITELNGVRSLLLGGSAVQSAIRLANPDQLELDYARAMMAALLFNESPRELLMIGLGGGSMARFAWSRLPDTRITAVEIDPRVVAAAHAWFGVPEEGVRFAIVLADGLAHLEAHPRSADLLLMDAFQGRDAPPHLRGERAYAACHAALRPNGILAQNFMATDPKLAECIDRISAAFDGRVLSLPAGDRANTIVFGFRTPARRWSIEHLRERAIRLDHQWALPFQAMLKDLLAHNPRNAEFIFLGETDCTAAAPQRPGTARD